MINESSFNRPIKLLSTRAYRTFIGGKLIDKMHNNDTEDSHFPEEWISSCTQAINIGREDIVEGLSYAVFDNDRIMLKELIEKSPEQLLGKEHTAKYGASLGILAKLIDSKERLAIQFHPNNEQAKAFFNSPFGKTECWHILAVRELEGDKPHIYLGLKEGVTRNEYIKFFNKQDVDALLSSLNKIYVIPRETYFVQGGIPHAIGPGCMLAELQEPTDFTLRVEKVLPSGLKLVDETLHLGLGYDKMFDCFDFTPFTYQQVLDRFRITPKTLEDNGNVLHQVMIDTDITSKFGIEKLQVRQSTKIDSMDSFFITKCISGNGEMLCDNTKYNVSSGSEFFVPAHSKDIYIKGQVELILFFPPTWQKNHYAQTI